MKSNSFNIFASRNKKIARIIGIAVLILTLFAAPGTSPVLADGNGTLAQSARIYLRGDVVSAGVGLRGTGSGDITLTGIPAGASVYRAYLYWATLGSANTYHSPTIDDVSVDGTLIGQAGDTCWNVQHNYVYRADVTDLIPGNGTYTIEGLPDSRLNGNDSQGASLVVIYQDPAENYRTIVIDDGAVALDLENNVYSDTITGYELSIQPVDAHITYLVGDGQLAYDSGDVKFAGTTLAENAFNGADGDFWDTAHFDVSDLAADSPVITRINNNDPNNDESPDCLLIAATIFSTTSPPVGPSQNRLSFFEQISLYGDVTAAGVGLRGTGEGDITISGIPVDTEVMKAYLFWATLGSSNQFASPTLNGVRVNGEHIATSADTCWNVDHNFVYRADVSEIVDGNGTYRIAGLPEALYGGGNDSQGASLVVFYGGNPSNQLLRTVIVHDGAVTLDLDIHSYTDTLTGFQSDAPTTEGRITYLIGDGQSRWDAGNVSFEGTTLANNVFNGIDGEYWGTLSFDVTTLVDDSSATTTIHNNPLDEEDSPDCLLWAATIFSVTQPQPDFDEFLYLPLISSNP